MFVLTDRDKAQAYHFVWLNLHYPMFGEYILH
jgi:hypothetical protein